MIDGVSIHFYKFFMPIIFDECEKIKHFKILYLQLCGNKSLKSIQKKKHYESIKMSEYHQFCVL